MSKRALRIVLGDRVVAYHPSFAKIMGGVSGGVWLSQIMYWDSVKAAQPQDYEADIWFYKTDAEIIGETCLTKREALQAKSLARELGFIKTELRGMPAKTNYCVDVEKILAAVDSCHNGVQLVARHRDNKLVQFHAQNLPQSTQESTQESTGAQSAQTKTAKIESPATVNAKKEIPPAVLAYRSVRSAYPRKELYQTIDETVGRDPDKIEFFKQVLIGWAGQGWNPQNVNGVLEFFKRGEIPKTKQGNIIQFGKPQREGKTEQLRRVLFEEQENG